MLPVRTLYHAFVVQAPDLCIGQTQYVGQNLVLCVRRGAARAGGDRAPDLRNRAASPVPARCPCRAALCARTTDCPRRAPDRRPSPGRSGTAPRVRRPRRKTRRRRRAGVLRSRVRPPPQSPRGRRQRSASSFRSAPCSASILLKARPRSAASAMPRRLREVNRQTMTSRPSAVRKSRPKVPYMWLPTRARSVVVDDRLADIAERRRRPERHI